MGRAELRLRNVRKRFESVAFTTSVWTVQTELQTLRGGQESKSLSSPETFLNVRRVLQFQQTHQAIFSFSFKELLDCLNNNFFWIWILKRLKAEFSALFESRQSERQTQLWVRLLIRLGRLRIRFIKLIKFIGSNAIMSKSNYESFNL